MGEEHREFSTFACTAEMKLGFARRGRRRAGRRRRRRRMYLLELGCDVAGLLERARRRWLWIKWGLNGGYTVPRMRYARGITNHTRQGTRQCSVSRIFCLMCSDA